MRFMALFLKIRRRNPGAFVPGCVDCPRIVDEICALGKSGKYVQLNHYNTCKLVLPAVFPSTRSCVADLVLARDAVGTTCRRSLMASSFKVPISNTKSLRCIKTSRDMNGVALSSVRKMGEQIKPPMRSGVD